MYIHYVYVGSGNERHRRYFIEADDQKPIAWFDDFDTAGTVMRYLKGSNLSPEERAAAHDAMKEFDNRGGSE